MLTILDYCSLANFKLYHILYFKMQTSLNMDIVVTTLVVQLL